MPITASTPQPTKPCDLSLSLSLSLSFFREGEEEGATLFPGAQRTPQLFGKPGENSNPRQTGRLCKASRFTTYHQRTEFPESTCHSFRIDHFLLLSHLPSAIGNTTASYCSRSRSEQKHSCWMASSFAALARPDLARSLSLCLFLSSLFLSPGLWCRGLTPTPHASAPFLSPLSLSLHQYLLRVAGPLNRRALPSASPTFQDPPLGLCACFRTSSSRTVTKTRYSFGSLRMACSRRSMAEVGVQAPLLYALA